MKKEILENEENFSQYVEKNIGPMLEEIKAPAFVLKLAKKFGK